MYLCFGNRFLLPRFCDATQRIWKDICIVYLCSENRFLLPRFPFQYQVRGGFFSPSIFLLCKPFLSKLTKLFWNLIGIKNENFEVTIRLFFHEKKMLTVSSGLNYAVFEIELFIDLLCYDLYMITSNCTKSESAEYT